MKIHHNSAMYYLLAHESVDMCPSRADPRVSCIRLTKQEFLDRVERQGGDATKAWRELCAEFKRQRCNHRELGRGIAFYVPRDSEETSY